MLFFLKSITHDTQKLHELMVHFFHFVSEQRPTSFDKTTQLPNWYVASGKTMRKLEGLLVKFFLFEEETRVEIISAFERGNKIVELFANTEMPPLALDFRTTNEDGSINSEVEEFLVELFVDCLYVGQLGKKDSPYSQIIQNCLTDHYNAFKALYANETYVTLCPFCGIEPLKMVNSEGRPDYDHMLPKGDSLYVFSSVNLGNLVPIGDHCNTLKEAKHLLFEDETRKIRKAAFYPYSLPPHPYTLIAFRLDCREEPSNANSWKGRWEIAIESRNTADLALTEKIASWKRVFNIKSRYEEYISEKCKFLLDKAIDKVNLSAPDLSTETVDKLNYFSSNYTIELNALQNEEGLVPKHLFYQWTLQRIDYVLVHVENKKNNPAVVDETMLEFS